MKSKIFAIVALLIFVGAAFWIVPILRNRYFNNPAEENGITENNGNENTTFNGQIDQDENSVPTNDLDQEDLDPEAEKGLEEEKKSLSEGWTIKESYLAIKDEDCANQCENFKKETKNLKYCQEVCGFSLIKENINGLDDCEEEEGLNQDYCLRDLAISKKDFKICEKIEDKKISENCKNRITEDIIDAQVQ